VSAAVNVNGGGFADTPNQRILVDPGPSATTAAQIGAAVLATGPGGTVRVGTWPKWPMRPRRRWAMP
jgi:hypothetical protein